MILYFLLALCILCMILSASILTVLFVLAKKERGKVNTLAQWMDREFESLHTAIDYAVEQHIAEKSAVDEMEKRVKSLEAGLVPDMNEARRAVEEINKMNSSIANILGYDEREAYEKAQNGGVTDDGK